MDARVRRVLAVRLQAEARGEWKLVEECDLQLRTWGVHIPPDVPEHPSPPPGEQRRTRTRKVKPVEET